jgi:hypothetical protein
MLALPEVLRTRPDSKAVDFEAYAGAKDPKFRTARLNEHFRALIWQISGERLLIWGVASHEQARQESRRKECEVNAVTRELEWHTVAAEDGPPAGEEPATALPRLLPRTVRDTDLRRMGLSNDLISVVRAISVSSELEALARLMPAVGKQLFAVQLLAAGESVEYVDREIATIPDELPNLGDYQGALVRSVNNGKLAVLASEEEVYAALMRPWDSWMVFLHPEQRQIAEAKVYNGPTRVVGGPGTGKSVVAVHRVRHLAAERGFLPGPSILVTTFVTTMADQLSGLIGSLLNEEEARQVRVISIDKLVVELLKATDYRSKGYTVLKQPAALDARIDTLREALPAEMSSSDVRRWWENVLLSMQEPTWAEYQRLRKRVRGLRQLSEASFAQLLRVLGLLEGALEQQRETTFLLRARECLASLPEDATRFQHVVVDEAQDLHPLHWRLLRRLVPAQSNDIFLVGDVDQRLYRTPFPLAHCGIEVKNRSKRLEKSYRCSLNILSFANRILSGVRAQDPDEGSDAAPPATSVLAGPDPECSAAADAAHELGNVVNRLRQWGTNGVPWAEMLVMCPTNARCEEVMRRLADEGIDVVRVGEAGSVGKDGVRVTTTHRAKGMEAKVAAVCGVGAAEFGIESLSAEELEKRRHVLFVACTRARQELYLSWVGEPSALLRSAIEARPVQ